MNKPKALPFIIGAIVVAIAVIVVFAQHATMTAVPASSYPTVATSGTTSASHESTNPNVSGGSVAGSSNTASATYTLAQVAMHNNASDCWTAINGGVYNVTSWIPQHPGGEEHIIALCGTDGSSAFDGQHGGQARPAAELASFKIGTLKQ